LNFIYLSLETWLLNRHDANSSRLTAVMNLLPDLVETEISQDELKRYLEIRPDLKTTVDY